MNSTQERGRRTRREEAGGRQTDAPSPRPSAADSLPPHPPPPSPVCRRLSPSPPPPASPVCCDPPPSPRTARSPHHAIAGGGGLPYHAPPSLRLSALPPFPRGSPRRRPLPGPPPRRAPPRVAEDARLLPLGPEPVLVPLAARRDEAARRKERREKEREGKWLSDKDLGKEGR